MASQTCGTSGASSTSSAVRSPRKAKRKAHVLADHVTADDEPHSMARRHGTRDMLF